MAYAIELRRLDPQPVVAIRVSVPMDAIAATMGSLFGEIYAYVERKGLQPAGPPYTRYYDFGPESVDMECGAPLAAVAEGEGRIVAAELPGGPAASTWHVGPYETLSEAYGALMVWTRESGREPAPGMWEVYHTEPRQVPDPAEWRTEVFVPLM